MPTDTEVRVALYALFAERGAAPAAAEVAARLGATAADVLAAYARLAEARALVLEPDGVTIRMAMPFSGVPTQHVVESAGVEYYANCAWDALGIPAALGRSARVRSRCEQSGETLSMTIDRARSLRVEGQTPDTWLFHSQQPAARWWDDIVFT